MDVDVVDNNQEKALLMASAGGHLDVVKLLLARRSRAKAETPTDSKENNDDEISASWKAAQWGGNAELVELLRSYL